MIRTLFALFVAALFVLAAPAEAGKIRQLSSAEGTEHENTTTEGSVCRYQFLAGSLTPGKIIEFECGVVVNDNNSTDTLTPAIRFGTSSTVTSNTSIAVGGAIDVADADVCIIRGTITVQSATRIVFNPQIADCDAAGTITMDGHGPVLFASTAATAYYLDVTLDWSVAHADNEAAAMSWNVIEHN